jgi:hypothetical protein
VQKSEEDLKFMYHLSVTFIGLIKLPLSEKKVIIIHVMVMGVTAVVFIGPPRIFHMNYTIFFNRIFYTREVFEGLC